MTKCSANGTLADSVSERAHVRCLVAAPVKTLGGIIAPEGAAWQAIIFNDADESPTAVGDAVTTRDREWPVKSLPVRARQWDWPPRGARAC